MAVLCVHGVLCVLGTALVILPHVNLGMLSDYKICGDSACESMISSAQAIRDHQGKDCRFLSFRRGETIFVYHKLTGKREDLWAGSIDKQFGYFPKDAVQEEQVYAAMEKVVETRKSDFFCMDEFGYPIDSTHLDSEDDDAADDESDKEIQIHKSEFTQTTTHTESSLESAGPDPTESTVSTQEAGRNEEKNNADPAEDTQNMAALDEQGGSPSSAWLSSSVTGWLGLTKEELPDHSPEEQKEQDNKDTQGQDSLASSVTSWLTLGQEEKPGNTKESVETGEETADSVASSIGGWLGFSREKKTDSANEEKEEPVEKFRSRRISLDLEGSQLDAEEEKDTGTFGWLRHGLTSTLGFDSSNKESSDDTSPEETEKDEKEPSSSAWLEIEGILDVKKDNYGDENEHTENSLKEKRNDEDTAGLEDKSNLEEPPKDQNTHSNVQNVDEEIKEDESFKKEQNKNNEVTSVETKDEDHEQNIETMEQKQQEIQIPIGSNQDSTTQADIYGPNHTFRSSIDEVKAEDEKNPVSVETGSDDDDDYEETGSNEEAALSHKETLSTQTENSADESQISSEQSQLSSFFSSDKSGDPVQAGNSSFTSHGEATNDDDTDTEAVTDINVETETGYNGLAQKKETPSTEGSAQEFSLLNFTRGDTESLMENSSEEEKIQIPLDGSTPNTKSDIEGGNDASDGGKQELMEEGNRKLEDSIKVDEIKELNQEEEEQLEDEARSDKPDDSREAEEIKEVEKQDKVEESVNEDGNLKLEDLMMVDEIKKETLEEVKVLESGEENDQLQDLKEAEDIKEETLEVAGLDKNEKQQGRGDVNEETVLEEIKETEKKGEDKNIKEQIIMFNPNEDDKDKDVAERTQENKDVELTESNGEIRVGVTELVKEQEKADEEELKEVDGLKELAKEETGEKQVQSSQFEVQNNPSDSSTPAPGNDEENIQDESVTSSFAESSTKTESPQSEEKWEDEDKKREEVAELEQAEEQHVEGDNLKCSKGLCTEGSAEEFVVEEGSTEDGGISISEEMTEKQSNHTNRTSERELIHSDGDTEHTRGLGTMEGKVEEEIREEVNQEEEEQSEDEERSDKPDDSREVEEKVEKQDKVEDLVDLMMVEVIKNEMPEEVKVDEENEQLEDLIGGEEIKEERQQEVGGLNGSKKLHERDGVKEEMVVEEIKEKESKEQDKTVTEQNIEEEDKDLEESASLGSSLTANDHSRGAADSETVGAFGLFKNTFGFFSQTPTTESVDSTEQAQPPNLNVINPSELQSSLTHTEDLDSIGEASQTQAESQESSGELPPSSTDLHTPSPNPEAPQQTKTLSKHYKNLLAHLDAEEMTILLDLFGQHKLQFLDYTLSSPEAEDPDGDQSIVSDMERLLEHHREKLFAPSMRIAEAPQEDKERTRTLVALQKLEAMLESVRKSFLSDVSIHQAEVSCVDTSCFTGEELRKIHDPSGNVDNVMQKDEFAFTDGGCGQDRDCVEDKTEANRGDIDSQSQRLQEGGMSQVLDFIRQTAGDSVTYSRELMERFTQVKSTNRFQSL